MGGDRVQILKLPSPVETEHQAKYYRSQKRRREEDETINFHLIRHHAFSARRGAVISEFSGSHSRILPPPVAEQANVIVLIEPLLSVRS